MHVRFLKSAEREFFQAEQRYENQREGLGTDFYREITALISEFVGYPFRFPIHGVGVRWGLTKRFPYAVIFEPRAEEIVIVAVMHTSRLPGYWKSRVTKK